jgi:hypothetical protein
MKRLAFLAALVVAAISVVAGSAMAAGGSVKASVVYNSTVPNGPKSNLPSVGAEAYAFNEFGNEVTLAGSARRLTSVAVTLSSWACVQGHWNTNDCSTPAGATFSQPITLNIYDPNDTVHPIATSTQTFVVPYRPSASAKCTGSEAGEWYQSSSKTCFNGLADNVTFSFSGVTLPDTVVYGIVYNTSHYGPTPQGETPACFGTAAGCPYDSLNIALSTDDDVSAGSSTSGTVWQNSPYGSQYCDGGSAGTGTFRADSGCWTPYVPAVQFKAGNGS